MMKPSEYFRHAQESLASGRIDEDTFWAMLDQASDFTEDDTELQFDPDDDVVDAIIEEGWLEEEYLTELHDRYCRMEGNA